MAIRSLIDIVKRQKPVMLPSTASVQDACRLMRDRRVGAVLVTDADQNLIGLFTGRDAVTRMLCEARNPITTTLSDVMTRNPCCAGTTAQALDALRLMQDGGFRHVPIVQDGRIVGIVSHGDFNGDEQARLDEETGFWEIL